MSMYPLPPDPYSDPKYDKKRGRWNLNRDDIGSKEIAAAFFAVGLFILVGLFLHIKSKNDYPHLIRVGDEFFVCHMKKADAVDESLILGTITGFVEPPVFPDEDESTNVKQFVGQPYAVDGDDRIYHLNENAAYRLSSFCHTYTDLDGLYPGLAFLNEFFSIDKDGRWSIIEKAMFSSYSGAMEDAIEPYHVGIAPYMTESGLLNVELGRMLYRLELQCKTEAKDWILGAIDIQPASKKDAYCYTISLSCEKDNTRLDKYYTGSYTVDENNLVDSFYVDF